MVDVREEVDELSAVCDSKAEMGWKNEVNKAE
jgi:hypothetical protein